LRRLLLVQTASVVVVCGISLAVGRSSLRIKGVLNGMYANPNDLAFAIALTIPLWFAFLLRKGNPVSKAIWAGAGLLMGATLVLTGSRGGFITLGIAALVCIWHFGVQGRRPLLIVTTIVAGLALVVVAGGTLKERFLALSSSGVQNKEEQSAYESFEQRSLLIDLSLHAIKDHPLLGLGPGDFTVYSGLWREVHLAYLQLAVEGGIPALILYLLIFWRALMNLRRVRRQNFEPEMRLFAWALHGTLIGFLVGALFAPDAYQYFPFFTVAYIAALRATAEEQSDLLPASPGRPRRGGFQLEKRPWPARASATG
jgi:O-antigen ligase